MKKTLTVLLAAFAAVVTLTGCDILGLAKGESATPAEKETVKPSRLVKEDELPVQSSFVLDETEPVPCSGDEDFVEYEIRVRETRNINEMTNFGVNDDVLYPGALIGGTAAGTGVMAPPRLPSSLGRKPLTFSVGGVRGVDASLAFTVENPTLSTTNDALNEKLQELVGGTVAANVELNFEEVYSEEQLAMSLGIGMNWPEEQYVKANIDFSESETKSRIVASYKQIYYTVSMDPPDYITDVLSGDESDIESFIADANPLYVSKVSYGRQIFLVFESSCSSQELKAAVDGAFSVDKEDLDKKLSVNFALSYGEILKNTTIKAIIYGGDTGYSSRIFRNNYEGFLEFIEEGESFNPENGSNALPLKYTLRYLSDNKVGALTTTADYTMKQYVRVRQGVRVSLDKIKCVGADDGYIVWPVSDTTCEFKGSVRVRSVSNADTVSEWQTIFDNWSSPIDMGNGTERLYDLSKDVLFYPVDKTASYVEIELSFKEDDISGDDNLGTVTIQQNLTKGWSADLLPQHMENEGAAIEVSLSLMALP